MSEYVISLTTRPGVGSPEWLDLWADHVYDDETLRAPAIALDRETGAVAATFTILAGSFMEAFEHGWQVLGRYAPEWGFSAPEDLLVGYTIELEDLEAREHVGV